MPDSIDIIAHNHKIVSPLYAVMMDSLAQLADATQHYWFAAQVRDRQLLGYLQYAPDITLIQAMEGLFYALSHSGSREALCRLIHGMFGVQSIVILEESANTLSISVAHPQVSTDYALAGNYTIASNGYSIASGSLSSVLGNDPLQFFKDFLPAGVIITGFHIKN